MTQTVIVFKRSEQAIRDPIIHISLRTMRKGAIRGYGESPQGLESWYVNLRSHSAGEQRTQSFEDSSEALRIVE